MNLNERKTPICDALRSRIGGRDSMVETDMADWEDKAIQLERQCQELAEALNEADKEICGSFVCDRPGCASRKQALANWRKKKGVKG